MVKKLKCNDAINEWYNSVGKEAIKEYVLDPDGIFASENGSKAGVYEVSVVTTEGKEILMYIGEVGKADRGFVDRLTEHLKYWITNPLWYAGIRASELKAGYKYKLCILAEEKDDEKRYDLEQKFVEELKPYLEYSCYPSYDRSKNHYMGYDLCIFPSYRRRAFLVARDGKYSDETPELVVNNIYSVAENENLRIYQNLTPDETIVERVKQEMPQGSNLHLEVKGFVEREMGIAGCRGYRYHNLVKLLAAALQPYYEEQRVM